MFIVTVHNHFVLSFHSILAEYARQCVRAEEQCVAVQTHFDKLNLINFIFTTSVLVFLEIL